MNDFSFTILRMRTVWIEYAKFCCCFCCHLILFFYVHLNSILRNQILFTITMRLNKNSVLSHDYVYKIPKWYLTKYFRVFSLFVVCHRFLCWVWAWTFTFGNTSKTDDSKKAKTKGKFTENDILLFTYLNSIIIATCSFHA